MAASLAPRDLGLSIIGVAAQYPPYALKPDALETLAKKYHPESESMKKVLSINRYTGIDQRSSIGTPDHPLVNQPDPPSIADIHKIFMTDGVPLAVSAARKAMAEARVEASQITHMVSTTCTNSANPGYDHFVARDLGLSSNLEKVLLHGIGCSGGLAALRTAANLCLGHAMRGLPARILCMALEVSTTMVRSELESIHKLQETRIGVALFSDCASAVVISNGIGEQAEPVYELLGWQHHIVPDTEEDLGFDVDPVGWKVVLSPRVPKLTQAVIEPTYQALLAAAPPLPPAYQAAADFDWAMHPGGATILTGAERAMTITPEHMRASYDTYINHGNSSSATIFSVLDRLRSKDMDAMAPGGRPKDYVVGCAFGPGIAVEMCLLKRNLGIQDMVPGIQTPPESEVSSRSGDVEEEFESDGPKAAEAGPVQHEQSEAAAARLKAAEDQSFISEALEGVELD
ncbi:chalcone and stilbene synthase [Thozetella sp. PMI_491]|nr:chalcone and stilbene synthase [Thozetella sp. PMI_491]